MKKRAASKSSFLKRKRRFGVGDLLFSGIGMTALGVLIGWLTEKKAPGCRAVGYMFLAGLGTLWHIELIILKVLFIFWLIFKLFSRTRYDD